MLAHHYDPTKSYVGWWMSRKLNGHRMLWDGGITFNKELREVPWYQGDLRLIKSTGLWSLGRYSGPKPVFAPQWFTDKLPIGLPLDGEIWHPSDKLAVMQSIMGQGKEKLEKDPRWKELIYQVFNSKPSFLWTTASSVSGSRYEYSLTYKFLKENLNGIDQVQLLCQTELVHDYDLRNCLQLAVNSGWEGLMLINPDSCYELKRSKNLLKVKGFYETEATVLGEEEGEGKHTGHMGSLKCKLVWDEKVKTVFGGNEGYVGREIHFHVGGGFKEGERVPGMFPSGTEINFSFLGVTESGVPVSPNFIRRV